MKGEVGKVRLRSHSSALKDTEKSESSPSSLPAGVTRDSASPQFAVCWGWGVVLGFPTPFPQALKRGYSAGPGRLRKE